MSGNYDFPGWYTPASGSPETTALPPPQWEFHRLPVASSTIGDLPSYQPNGGLSIVNYLATTTPKTGVTKDSAIRVNPDVWGQGYGGIVGVGTEGLGVQTPLGARSWTFTLDVSTQLVDTIIVNQNYINVQIISLNQDRTDIGAQTSATVTATLKNTSNFPGIIYQNCDLPTQVIGSGEVIGSNEIRFDANEQKTVTFQVRNTGNLAETQSNVQFLYKLVNTVGATTDERVLTFNFLAGLGQPSTSLTVNCVEDGTNTRINGLLAKIYYGATGNDFQSFNTQDGSVTFDLGLYTGAVTLQISDPIERYESKTLSFNVVSGVNTKTVVFAHGIPETPWWENMYLWITLGAVAMILTVLVGVVYYKRK